MTLGGLALAVGILVDEATVAIENIHAQLRARRAARRAPRCDGNARDGAAAAAGDALHPGGVHPGVLHGGRGQGALRAAGAGGRLLDDRVVSAVEHAGAGPGGLAAARPRARQSHEASFFARLQRAYARLAARRVVAAALAARARLSRRARCSSSGSSAPRLGTEIFPQVDAGQFALRLRAPDRHAGREHRGSSRCKVLDIIKREAGADNVAITMGLVGVHASSYPVNLIHLWNGGPEEGVARGAAQARHAACASRRCKEKLRGVFAQRVAGRARSRSSRSDIVIRVMSFGSPTPIEVAVSGPDLAVSREHAEKIFAEAARDSRAARRAVRPGARLSRPWT